MKFRCPYCKNVLGENAVPICPKCGKGIKIPESMRESIGRIKEEKTKDREAARLAGQSLTADILNLDSPLGPLLLVVIIISGIAMFMLRDKSKYKNVEFKDPKTLIADAERRSHDMAVSEAHVLRMGLEIFKHDCGRYPTTREGLVALLNNPKAPGWKGPYVTFLRPDPWRAFYNYSCTNGVMRIFSSGPDGIPDTADDIIPPEPTEKEKADYDLDKPSTNTVHESH